MKVGFIGLGKMGAGICSNIVKNGIDVVVYDINPANMQKFVDMGASSAATVKELAAQVDVCITCVPMPKDAKGVLLGPDGVFENLPEGGVHFDLSTLDIETVVMLEAEAAKLGKKYLVIPMGKGPAFAADGTCPLFGGGDKATYDKYEECLLKKMGKPAYIGDVKAGCALKLIQFRGLLLPVQEHRFRHLRRRLRASGVHRESGLQGRAPRHRDVRILRPARAHDVPRP